LLDQLSSGRFRLGVGRGGPWVDLEVFGTGLDSYQHGFAEALERVGKGGQAALAFCQGRRPGAGARRRVMSPIMVHLTMASACSGRRS